MKGLTVVLILFGLSALCQIAVGVIGLYCLSTGQTSGFCHRGHR